MARINRKITKVDIKEIKAIIADVCGRWKSAAANARARGGGAFDAVVVAGNIENEIKSSLALALTGKFTFDESKTTLPQESKREFLHGGF